MTPSLDSQDVKNFSKNFANDMVKNANIFMDIMTHEQLKRLHDTLERAEQRLKGNTTIL